MDEILQSQKGNRNNRIWWATVCFFIDEVHRMVELVEDRQQNPEGGPDFLGDVTSQRIRSAIYFIMHMSYSQSKYLSSSLVSISSCLLYWNSFLYYLLLFSCYNSLMAKLSIAIKVSHRVDLKGLHN